MTFLAVVSSQLPSSDIVLSSVLCKFSHKKFSFFIQVTPWVVCPLIPLVTPLFSLTFKLHKNFMFNHNATAICFCQAYISLCLRVMPTVAINQATARPASGPNYPLYDELADDKLMRAINRGVIIWRRSPVSAIACLALNSSRFIVRILF